MHENLSCSSCAKNQKSKNPKNLNLQKKGKTYILSRLTKTGQDQEKPSMKRMFSVFEEEEEEGEGGLVSGFGGYVPA